MTGDPVANSARDAPHLTALRVFLCFAFAYFFSALVRGVTATLAPQFGVELGLTAGDLGLLAGAYFLGFAATQLPLGSALDRIGPRRVLIGLLGLAVLGCVAFALARSFLALTLARALIGVGVSACLMAPMTTFRHRFDDLAQIRANSWMLMTGSMGMVASTLPVQWLLPMLGWRGLFWALAGMFVLAMVAIRLNAPADEPPAAPATAGGAPPGYRDVWRHRTFRRLLPIGFFCYGGLIAMQSLWVGPWLVQVCGWPPAQAARGLFAVNVAMLLSFMAWGFVVPRLYARGLTAQRLIGWLLPLSLSGLVLAWVLGTQATTWVWVVFCAGSSVVSLSQPAVGQAFDAGLAGRALSAFNLVIFLGVFAVQWGLGLAIDVFRAIGWDTVSAYRGAIALFAVCCALSYVWFLCRAENASTPKLDSPR